MKETEHKSHGENRAQTQKTQVALLTLWHFDTFASEKRDAEHKSHAEGRLQTQKTQVALLTL
jgi:hypothetical protein